MRVLWFSNTPALGVEYLNKDSKIKGTGGWMQAFNEAFANSLDLHIAFHYPYKINSFNYKNTSYYPIYTGNILIKRLLSRFTRNIENKRVNEYYLQLIKKIKPDIIHIHGTENSFLSILEKTKVPTVVSIQGNITVINYKFISGFHGEYINQKKINSLKQLILGPHCFKDTKIMFSKKAVVEQKLMRHIKNVIGRTDWDYRITRVFSPESKYFKGEELLRVPFYNSKWDNKYKSGKLVLFTTSGDNYYKGIETIFYSLTLLQRNGIDIEWRIAGINENSLIVSICKKYLSSNFPKSGYKLLGSLDENALVQELEKAHMYIMPSHIENSPNNLCEAMILGMPCIATFAGGTGSILKDGEEGILIQDGDPWAMTGAIISYINEPNKMIQYAENARKRALERHDKELVIKNYNSIYMQILQENASE